MALIKEHRSKNKYQDKKNKKKIKKNNRLTSSGPGEVKTTAFPLGNKMLKRHIPPVKVHL